MGVGQKKNARNSPIGRITKGDHLLWSDLHYILLLQNRQGKVKLFFSLEEPPGPLRRASKGGKEAAGGGRQILPSFLTESSPSCYIDRCGLTINK
jgi:hypothetical protein